MPAGTVLRPAREPEGLVIRECAETCGMNHPGGAFALLDKEPGDVSRWPLSGGSESAASHPACTRPHVLLCPVMGDVSTPCEVSHSLT